MVLDCETVSHNFCENSNDAFTLLEFIPRWINFDAYDINENDNEIEFNEMKFNKIITCTQSLLKLFQECENAFIVCPFPFSTPYNEQQFTILKHSFYKPSEKQVKIFYICSLNKYQLYVYQPVDRASLYPQCFAFAQSLIYFFLTLSFSYISILINSWNKHFTEKCFAFGTHSYFGKK